MIGGNNNIQLSSTVPEEESEEEEEVAAEDSGTNESSSTEEKPEEKEEATSGADPSSPEESRHPGVGENPCAVTSCSAIEEAAPEEEDSYSSMQLAFDAGTNCGAGSTPLSKKMLSAQINLRFARLRGYTNICGTLSVLIIMTAMYTKCMEMKGYHYQNCGILALVLIAVTGLLFLIINIFLSYLESRELDEL